MPFTGAVAAAKLEIEVFAKGLAKKRKRTQRWTTGEIFVYFQAFCSHSFSLINNSDFQAITMEEC